MPELADLEAILRSRIPLVVIETHEEPRVLDLFRRLAVRTARPVFHWTITQGLQRLDVDYGIQSHTREPESALRQIKSTGTPGVYVLADFHPFLDQPSHVRLIKEIALQYPALQHTLVFVSHRFTLPEELERLAARLELAMPDDEALLRIVREEANAWSRDNGQRKVSTGRDVLNRLVRNLQGLSASDARRLVRQAIVDDGAITESDLPEVTRAKYDLLDQGGLLAFEFDTERFSRVGGLLNLRRWLELRRTVFLDPAAAAGLEPPRGMLLVGVQGCGKSLAAKAVAGAFGAPLLRLDFGALYNKFFGESERNLRQALTTAELMAPCVLWMDEIEKGVAADSNDGGTSRRLLGTLLTWMAERRAAVFLVATANDISALPPELVRKGRFDEIFFVDLPVADVRGEILAIHLQRRGLALEDYDLEALAADTEGFSGAELEQAVVAALYRAHADGRALSQEDLREEIRATRPLATVMAERIQALREWARDRTVPADS